MADKALGGISVKVLKDESRVRFKGELNYEPADSTEKWVYQVHSVPASPAVIFTTNDEFFGEANAPLQATDNVLWIAIKHSGTSDGTNTTAEGIMVNYEAGNAPLWNGTDGAHTNNMIVGPNELFVFRPNGTEVQDILVGTVKLTGNKASATGTGTVEIYVSAIIDDGA